MSRPTFSLFSWATVKTISQSSVQSVRVKVDAVHCHDLIFHSFRLNPNRSDMTPDTADRMTTWVML